MVDINDVSAGFLNIVIGSIRAVLVAPIRRSLGGTCVARPRRAGGLPSVSRSRVLSCLPRLPLRAPRSRPAPGLSPLPISPLAERDSHGCCRSDAKLSQRADTLPAFEGPFSGPWPMDLPGWQVRPASRRGRGTPTAKRPWHRATVFSSQGAKTSGRSITGRFVLARSGRVLRRHCEREALGKPRGTRFLPP